VRNNYQSFVNELMDHSQVHDVGAMSQIIGGSREPMIIELNQNNDTNEEGFAATYFGFDNGALKIANLKLIMGNGFTGNKNIDSASVIINETTAKLLISDLSIWAKHRYGIWSNFTSTINSDYPMRIQKRIIWKLWYRINTCLC